MIASRKKFHCISKSKKKIESRYDKAPKGQKRPPRRFRILKDEKDCSINPRLLRSGRTSERLMVKGLTFRGAKIDQAVGLAKFWAKKNRAVIARLYGKVTHTIFGRKRAAAKLYFRRKACALKTQLPIGSISMRRTWSVMGSGEENIHHVSSGMRIGLYLSISFQYF